MCDGVGVTAEVSETEGGRPARSAVALVGVVAAMVVPLAVSALPTAVAAPIAAEQVTVTEGDQVFELRTLVELALRRLNTADAVAAAKWATAQRTGEPPVVDDPAREAQVYESMAAAGARSGLPQSWVRQVFRGQIEANKTVQHGLLARWRFDPASAPAPGTSELASVRPVIDEVNDEILAQLAAHRGVLEGSDCAERVAAAAFSVLTSGAADALHSAALVRAAVSLCPATVVK